MSSQPPYGSSSAPQGKTKVLGLDYNIAGLLCYLLACLCLVNVIASIIWLVTEPKENKIVRFHALQGLLLFGVGVVLWIVFMFLGVGMTFAPSNAASAGGGLLISLVFWVCGLILFILHVIGMVKAYQQQIWKIPVIGSIADKNS